MPAFQPYDGVYEHDGGRFSWRCYATARVHEVRLAEHEPFPGPPDGMKWAWPPQKDERRAFASLVDETLQDFSQILVQVSREPAEADRSTPGLDDARPAPPQQP